MTSLIDELKRQHDELQEHLLVQQPTLAVGTAAVLAKSLVLACASEIEHDFQANLGNYYASRLGEDHPAVKFVVNKAIKRQYHTYFSWDGNNVNSFLGLFGAEHKALMIVRLEEEPELKLAAKSFLRLGDLRNTIVHENFGAYGLDSTVDEIYRLYEEARRFCDALPGLLEEPYQQ